MPLVFLHIKVFDSRDSTLYFYKMRPLYLTIPILGYLNTVIFLNPEIGKCCRILLLLHYLIKAAVYKYKKLINVKKDKGMLNSNFR